MVHQAIIYKDQTKAAVVILSFSDKYLYPAPFATRCSMLDAGLGFTNAFHSSAHGWNKCLYHLSSGVWARSVASLQGQGCCQAAAQSPPWSLLKLHWGDCPLPSHPGDGTVMPLHFSPLLRSHPFLPSAGAGQQGPPEPPWRKNPINEKPGGGQPPGWAVPTVGPGLQGRTASGTGPSCGSNPLPPAPLTKKTLLLLQFGPLSQTSEVRWYK